jgi:hypothetical protein
VFEAYFGTALDGLQVPFAVGIACAESGKSVVVGEKGAAPHALDVLGKGRWGEEGKAANYHPGAKQQGELGEGEIHGKGVDLVSHVE